MSHHAVQVVVLIVHLSVDVIGQLSHSETQQDTNEAGRDWDLLVDELGDGLTDFRRDTLEARLSARRLFSASSMSSTDPGPGDTSQTRRQRADGGGDM